MSDQSRLDHTAPPFSVEFDRASRYLIYRYRADVRAGHRHGISCFFLLVSESRQSHYAGLGCIEIMVKINVPISAGHGPGSVTQSP
jgi:hypothetical protein